MASTPTAPRPRGKRHPGPPLAAPALAFVVLFIASAAIGPILGDGASPSPFGTRAALAADLAAQTTSAQVSGCLLVFAALFLAVFAAIAQSRLEFLAPNAPGPAIAGAGGQLAAVLLAFSALCRWALSRGDVVADPALARALNDIAFVAGGPAHAMSLAPLVLGFAITAWFVHRTPRGLSVTGFVVAALCLLSSLTLAAPALAPLVAVGRFTAMAWLVVMAVRFPRERGPRNTAARAPRVALTR